MEGIDNRTLPLAVGHFPRTALPGQQSNVAMPGHHDAFLQPRIKNKFLFRGRIWVEGQDFAVARMEGEPARNPSWWTKRNAIHVTYEKIGEFWLPARDETNTQVRIVGRSSLTIVYQDYQILETRSGQLAPAGAGSSAAGRESSQLSAARR